MFNGILFLLCVLPGGTHWRKYLIWLSFVFITIATHYGTMMAHRDKTIIDALTK